MLRKYLQEITKDAPISIAEYVRLCLYHPQFGYYMKPRTRVGKSGDFYTASSVNGGVFSKLLLESARHMSAGLSDFEIAEIGAEPERALFKDASIIRVGQCISLEGGIFLFANELLDAQPFDRFKFAGGKILKTFVKFSENAAPEISYENASVEEIECLQKYSDTMREGAVLDFSFDALALLKSICAQNWRGALIFPDYYRTRAELADFASGSARTYNRHKASKDIFANPGDEDITFSPPFEEFEEILENSGFKNVSCKSQAAFFMENAAAKIRDILENSDALSVEKRALSELISPTHMGEFFRILAGVR